MTWEQFLAEGDYAVTLIRNGLRKRGIIDKRKTAATGQTYYIYPSYCVPTSEIISKDEVINYIQQLSISC